MSAESSPGAAAGGRVRKVGQIGGRQRPEKLNKKNPDVKTVC